MTTYAVAKTDARRLGSAAIEWLRPHWGISVVVLVGLVVRALMMVAYPPALFFPDSWGYIGTAYSGLVGSLPTVHPIGYPILIKLFTLPDRSLAELTAFQHLAGTLSGIAVYAALLRAGLPKWGAVAAASLVLLDGYGITLEQYVMSDTFFGITVLAAVLVLAWPYLVAARAPAPQSPGRDRLITRCVAAGLLVAGASLEREAAPFVLPVFAIYVVWVGASWRAVLAFIVAAAVPLLAYSAVVDADFHVFGLTATPGWTLYGRVAGFADCNGLTLKASEQRLCETKAQRDSHPSAPDWYIWGPSPAQKVFHPATQSRAQIAPTNTVLESFSKTVIKHQPLDFVSATIGDFLRYFTPDAVPYNDAASATSLPRTASREASDPAVQARDLPGLKPKVQSPAGLVRWYRRVVHVPRPILAVLALAALLALLLRVPARREIFLAAGTGAMLLLGTAATGGFALRYLIPSVPLLAIGGSLALTQVASALRSRERGRVRTGRS